VIQQDIVMAEMSLGMPVVRSRSLRDIVRAPRSSSSDCDALVC
jgi:hypothetical protein